MAIAAAPLVVGAIGLLLDRSLIRWLYHDPVKSMLGTFGLAIVLRQLVLIFEGPQLRHVGLPVTGAVPLGFGEQFPIWRVAIIAFAVATDGRRRAVADALRDRPEGPHHDRRRGDRAVAGHERAARQRAAFALGAALAGLAGALVAPLARSIRTWASATWSARSWS